MAGEAAKIQPPESLPIPGQFRSTRRHATCPDPLRFASELRPNGNANLPFSRLCFSAMFVDFLHDRAFSAPDCPVRWAI